MPARQIFYTGKVQGVGFRYATKRIATGYEVTGSVRNLADGRVELQVMSADAAELTAFLEEIEVNSELAHHIKEKEVHVIPPLEGVKGFSIVR
jgi:acylphosphatase